MWDRYSMRHCVDEGVGADREMCERLFHHNYQI